MFNMQKKIITIIKKTINYTEGKIKRTLFADFLHAYIYIIKLEEKNHKRRIILI